jgi:hypothetical protein
MIDPILLFSVIFMQIGSRHLDLELSETQKKILKNKYMQYLILFSIVYISTRSFEKSFLIVICLYIFLKVLFNENSKYNLLSKNFLKEEGLLNKDFNIKELYYDNFTSLYI